ncbi:ferritin-like domain-containing protein [uncultured Helicobacter sp.]|uniref:ferritin-like domain-containing protein n=1 Tax=uncultured Helicobacter sp. TaxID=175537 RepID=UPI00262C1B69|nr:ferritin-like domain-containing protein [uncultured Helicobacter sp.]
MELRELFSSLFNALNAKNAQEKCKQVQIIWKNFHNLSLEHNQIILPLEIPTFAHFCSIVPPYKVPQGKYLKTDLNVAHLLHSIAHIEFSAIDLALDCAYRFRELPHCFYRDWVEVANEEVKHFLALNSLLEVLGFHYGDFGVHTLLFDSMKNCNILLNRIALIHRGMEAVGLDVNPFLCIKVQNSNHSIKNELLNVLEMILQDEISHVLKGSIWFNFFCEQEKILPKNRTLKYFEILKHHHFSFPKANEQLNANARLKAGFSLEELKMLEDEIFLSKNPK